MAPTLWQQAMDLKIPLFRLLARLLDTLERDTSVAQVAGLCNRTSKQFQRPWRDQWSFLADGFFWIAQPQIQRLHQFLVTPVPVKGPCEGLQVAGDYVLAFLHLDHGSMTRSPVPKEKLLALAAWSLTVALLKASQQITFFLHSAWPVWWLLADAGFMTLLQSDIIHQEEFFAWISPMLPDKPVIFEAGSYDGKHSKLMALAWPQGRVYAWEGQPTLCNHITGNLQNFSNIVSWLCC